MSEDRWQLRSSAAELYSPTCDSWETSHMRSFYRSKRYFERRPPNARLSALRRSSSACRPMQRPRNYLASRALAAHPRYRFFQYTQLEKQMTEIFGRAFMSEG